MTVEWTPLATAHLRSVFEYIARDNSAAAERVLAQVFAGVERLERFPNMGRSGRLEGSRELVMAGTPFVVPHRINRNRVEILAVFHASRKWPEQF